MQAIGAPVARGILAGAIALALVAPADAVAGTTSYTEKVLYSFCTSGGYSCTDGAGPRAGLIADTQGNLYGTTYAGGAYRGGRRASPGTVFKVTPQGQETVLYTFCSQAYCTDGKAPQAGLIADSEGNLYGTTSEGGSGPFCLQSIHCGTVFKLTPQGRETVLYNFCSQGNCTDGANPFDGVIADAKGNLYGTTFYGGTHCVNRGCGVAFKVTPKGKETVLYTFCARGGSKCTDGGYPSAGLLADAGGDLYGTTETGGANCRRGACGTVFKVTRRGKETVLYSFCAQGSSNCTDGAAPSAGLMSDAQGNLFGTTYLGGAGTCNKLTGCSGTVFELTPENKETVLHTFCSQTNCTDGLGPQAGLIADAQGNLYGTTPSGGANCQNGGDTPGCGTVFEVTPQGQETVLYSFCSQANCTDGGGPEGSLVADAQGNLYGTTAGGGAGCTSQGACGGTVFELVKNR